MHAHTIHTHTHTHTITFFFLNGDGTYFFSNIWMAYFEVLHKHSFTIKFQNMKTSIFFEGEKMG